MLYRTLQYHTYGEKLLMEQEILYIFVFMTSTNIYNTELNYTILYYTTMHCTP